MKHDGPAYYPPGKKKKKTKKMGNRMGATDGNLRSRGGKKKKVGKEISLKRRRLERNSRNCTKSEKENRSFHEENEKSFKSKLVTNEQFIFSYQKHFRMLLVG